MCSDASQNVGEPLLRIHVVHLYGDDQAVHHGSKIATAIEAAEQLGLPPKGDTSHGTFGGIVRQVDVAVVKRVNALQHLGM